MRKLLFEWCIYESISWFMRNKLSSSKSSQANMQIQPNRSLLFGTPLLPADSRAFAPEVVGEVVRHLAHVPHKLTALHLMPELAHARGVKAVMVKDESERSSLGSFKAMGGTHAVIRLVLAAASRNLGCLVTPEQLHDPAVKQVAASLTFACATDGNHGRAVAAGARIAGARSEVFVHEGVSAARARAIEAEGAVVTRTPGHYDDSIAALNAAAAECGWQVVSDTSWPGYEEIPTLVMQGYLVMADEAVQQAHAAGSRPTHVFLQAGVGGYAAAVAAFLHLKLGKACPRVVVVEPERAACIFESATAGRATRIEASEPTVMGMLECYEPSQIAWRILERTASAFMTIEDPAAIDAMKTLARPAGSDPKVVAGESGGAGLAGLLRATDSDHGRRELGLDERSVVLIFNTEGATDAAAYQRLIGSTDDER
jgi:diaminopropionate ammonia-lyase